MKTPLPPLLLAVALVAVPSAHAVLQARALERPLPVAGLAGAPLAWPDTAPPRFALSRVEGVWDEMPVTYQRLTAGRLELQGRLTDFDAWRVEPAGPHSLNLAYRWAPGVQAYLAWFPRGTFLPSLDDSSWLRYLKGLEARYRGPVAFEINDDSAVNAQMLRPMGRRTRVLAFQAPGAEPGAAPWSVLQVALELPDGVLVYGLEGPAPAAVKARGFFGRFVSSLDLAETF